MAGKGSRGPRCHLYGVKDDPLYVKGRERGRGTRDASLQFITCLHELVLFVTSVHTHTHGANNATGVCRKVNILCSLDEPSSRWLIDPRAVPGSERSAIDHARGCACWMRISSAE